MSDRLPVIAELNIFISVATITRKIETLKPKWDKCDKNVYQMCIENNILKNFPDEIQSEFDFLAHLNLHRF